MKPITNLQDLEALYGTANSKSRAKVVTKLTPGYRAWIETARFCILTTVGPEGTDSSPRGDVGPVMRIINDQILHLPDWSGNNRLDSLKNIIRDGRVSLMLLVPGQGNVIRINGTAQLFNDPTLCKSFEQNQKHPKTVIEITIQEAYFQCAKAIMRSNLWSMPHDDSLPKAGALLQEQIKDFDAKAYDEGYENYARPLLW